MNKQIAIGRGFGIISPTDAEKTTLTGKTLNNRAAIQEAGNIKSVDIIKKVVASDFMEIERPRGIFSDLCPCFLMTISIF